MSGNQSEGQVGPSRPEEEREFLAANQDVLEDALSYAVSNVIQTRAGGKNGAHAVAYLGEQLLQYAKQVNGGERSAPSQNGAGQPLTTAQPNPSLSKGDAPKGDEPSEKKADGKVEWQALKWLKSNPSILKAIYQALMKGEKTDAEGAEYEFCKKLGTEEGKALISTRLTSWQEEKKSLLDELTEKIHVAAKRLTNNTGSTRDLTTNTGTKYEQSDVVSLNFGGLATFYLGLEAFIGPPMLHLADAIKWEHCSAPDASMKLQAHNYGTETTSKIEWHFVVAPTDESLRELDIKAWPEDTRLSGQKNQGDGKLAEDALRGAVPRKAQSLEETFRPVLNLRNEKLRELDQPPLRDEEFYAARLYTGPMYLKYNASLRCKGMRSVDGQNKNKQWAEKQFLAYCNGNWYTSTIHAINSAVVKLGKLSKATKVYRGISNRALSKEMLMPNEYNVRGGVEFAFMSTTPIKKVAMEYAESGKINDASMVFEIKMGMIDRGADVSWLSQYPHEDERLFPPLTALSLEDDEKVEDDVTVFKVRLNVNLIATTLEQMESKMQRSHVSMIDLLSDDLRFAGVPSKLLAPLRHLKTKAESRKPSDFTDVDMFKTATEGALETQQEIFDKLCEGDSLFSAIQKADDEEERERELRLRHSDSSPEALHRRPSQTDAQKKKRLRRTAQEAARVAAGSGVSGNKSAVQLLKKSFKYEEPRQDVEDVIKKYGVPQKQVAIIQVLWLLIHKFDADQPWPGVIVEMLSSEEQQQMEQILPAFTDMLKSWVEAKGKLREKAVKTRYVDVYAKGQMTPWTYAKLTGNERRSLEDPGVTLVEATLGKKQDGVWVDKNRHVLYPGYNGATAILFEAVKMDKAPLIKAVLDANVSVFSFDRDANTALIAAALDGKLEACKILKQMGADEHQFNKRRVNAFDMAVLGGHADVKRIIDPSDCDKQARVPDKNKVTPLMLACYGGDQAKVDELIGTSAVDAKTEPPAVKGKDGRDKPSKQLTALLFAADNGNSEIFAKVLAHAKPNEDQGLDALLIASIRGNKEVAEQLIRYNKELVKKADAKGNQAIHKAAQYGHDELLSTLIMSNADPKAANDSENTPLMLASRFGHDKAAAILLTSGADKNRDDDKGWTSLMRAAANGHQKVMLEMLKDKGGELRIDAQDKQGTTALMAACTSGQLDTTASLLDNDAKLELQDTKDGYTALHRAAISGHEEVVQAILQQPAEIVRGCICIRDNRGMTPLMAACEHGHAGTVRRLLSLRHSKNDGSGSIVRESDGYTALMIAVEQGHEEVVRVILQQTNADVHQVAVDGVTTALTLAKGDQRVLTLLHQVRTVLFQSHQQTEIAFDVWNRWLRGREPESIKVSLPPFNKRGVPLPQGAKEVNVPVFGAAIPKEIMKCFEGKEIKEHAKELGVNIPGYKLQSFVQGKMFKVKVLVQAARDLGTCDEPADKLEAFVEAFETLTPEEVPDPVAWKRFVEQHVALGWERRLHFDHVLQNFGFDDATAKKLRKTLHKETDQKTNEETSTDLETYAFRWLGKAFTGYNVTGCLTDVANLLFAMDQQHSDPKEGEANLGELEVADTLSRVVEKVTKGNLAGLWVPTHLVHDSETDDLLCWLLLEHIHRKLGSQLEVLVQMPPANEPDLTQVIAEISSRPNVQTFRDRDSRNERAVREALHLRMLEKHQKKKG